MINMKFVILILALTSGYFTHDRSHFLEEKSNHPMDSIIPDEEEISAPLLSASCAAVNACQLQIVDSGRCTYIYTQCVRDSGCNSLINPDRCWNGCIPKFCNPNSNPYPTACINDCLVNSGNALYSLLYHCFDDPCVSMSSEYLTEEVMQNPIEKQDGKDSVLTK